MVEVELSLRIPEVTFGQWDLVPPSKYFLKVVPLGVEDIVISLMGIKESSLMIPKVTFGQWEKVPPSKNTMNMVMLEQNKRIVVV